MDRDPKTTSPEREQTNESLRTERERSDGALAARQAAVEENADGVVRRARDNADAVLLAARVKADERRGPSEDPLPVAVVADERKVEDEALQAERASADESLRNERDETARALSRLLPLERQKTDRYLLTERARSDDALSHRDDFLSIVSHDLRNLLSGIVMTASLLSETGGSDRDDAKALAGAKRIQRYAARMNRLIGDLVDVASIDAGHLAVSASTNDASALVSEVVDTFQGAASEKGVSLMADVALAPMMGEFDYDRILQVLANLITNAVKFTNKGGTIAVRGESRDGAIRLAITDSGMGIPAHLLEAIFERFWQVGSNDRRGVGLGLYISKCIVEAHRGKIWAESILGEGTTLTFTLPGVGLGTSRPPALPPKLA